MIRTEIHIPISPTPDFLIRVHYLAASIEMYSGLSPGSYKIVVTVGDATRVDIEDLCPWAIRYPIEWRWVPDQEWLERGIFATAFGRFRYAFEADAVVMLDGDVLVTGSLAEMVNEAVGTLRFHAIPAHYSPFCYQGCLEQRSPHEWWAEIFRLAGLSPPILSMEHLAWPWMQEQDWPYLEQLQFGPPYPNAGVIIGSAETMRRIGASIYEDLDTVNTVFCNVLSGQVALSLAISRQGLEWAPLPLRYNVPNVQQFHDTYPDEAADVRVLHFLQTTEIDRVADFQSYAHLEQALNRSGLSPLNAFLAERLRSVHLAKVSSDLHVLSAREFNDRS